MDSLLLTSLALADLWRYAWPALVVAALALIIFEVRRLLRWMESEIGAARDRRRAGREGGGAAGVPLAARSFVPPLEPGRARAQVPSPTVEALRPGPAVARALAVRAAGAAAAGLPRMEAASQPMADHGRIVRPVKPKPVLELSVVAVLLAVVVIMSLGHVKKPSQHRT